MPALRLYGRKWKIADDDFVIPELIEGGLRIIWMGIVIYAAASSFTEAKECSYKKFLVAYVACVLASCILTTVLTFATAWVSARGSLADGRPRRGIKWLLYTRLPLLAFDVACAAFGTAYFVYSKHRGKTPCQAKNLMRAIKTTVIANWILLAIYLIVLYLLSRPERNRHKKKIQKHDKRKEWDKFLNSIFKCGGGGAGGKKQAVGAPGALNDVASLLAYAFPESDLAFTDVLAGLRLLSAAQELEEPPHTHRPTPHPDRQPWMRLSLAARYIRYAAGMYGWPHFTAAYGPKGLYKVYRKMACPCKNPVTHPDQSVIRLDNCCYCNTAVLLQMTDKYGPDLRFFTLHNAIYEVPFSVLLDHEVKSIVLVVRGSLTLADWVTDLSVVGEEYKVPDGKGGYTMVKGHKGFFESGKYITKVVRDEQLFDKLLEEYPDYDIVITGQSLGAGVAPPLTLYLREWYPNIQCFAYSPPGCVISCANLELTKRNICTVVVGDDLVSHMSMRSLDKMQNDINRALKSCYLPKYKVLRCGYRSKVPQKAVCVNPEDPPEPASGGVANGTEQKPPSSGAPMNTLTSVDLTDSYEDKDKDASLTALEPPGAVSLAPGGLDQRTAAAASAETLDDPRLYPEVPKMMESPPLSTSSSSKTSSSPSAEPRSPSAEHCHMMEKHLKSDDLCLPGNIMYVFKPPAPADQWVLSWETAENFHHIIISSKVIDHHFPFTVCKVLAEAQLHNDDDGPNPTRL